DPAGHGEQVVQSMTPSESVSGHPSAGACDETLHCCDVARMNAMPLGHGMHARYWPAPSVRAVATAGSGLPPASRASRMTTALASGAWAPPCAQISAPLTSVDGG